MTISRSYVLITSKQFIINGKQIITNKPCIVLSKEKIGAGLTKHYGIISGHIDAGENPMQAAIREANEETLGKGKGSQFTVTDIVETGFTGLVDPSNGEDTIKIFAAKKDQVILNDNDEKADFVLVTIDEFTDKFNQARAKSFNKKDINWTEKTFTNEAKLYDIQDVTKKHTNFKSMTPTFKTIDGKEIQFHGKHFQSLACSTIKLGDLKEKLDGTSHHMESEAGPAFDDGAAAASSAKVANKAQEKLFEAAPKNIMVGSELKSILNEISDCDHAFFPNKMEFAPDAADLLENHLPTLGLSKLSLDLDFYPISNKEHLVEVCGQAGVKLIDTHLE